MSDYVVVRKRGENGCGTPRYDVRVGANQPGLERYLSGRGLEVVDEGLLMPRRPTIAETYRAVCGTVDQANREGWNTTRLRRELGAISRE